MRHSFVRCPHGTYLCMFLPLGSLHDTVMAASSLFPSHAAPSPCAATSLPARWHLDVHELRL
eukprot:12494301-Prorocentrum_lima.AAC.1